VRRSITAPVKVQRGKPSGPRTCSCGGIFMPQNINAWHCSDRCRFEAKFAKRGPDECWIWSGATNDDGYGLFVVKGRSFKAHRFAMMMASEVEIPACVLHRCDVPACVNPRHLFLGTHSDNMRDREAKGRANHPRGEHSGQSKLTEENVRAIREASARGVKRYELAAKYGVSAPAISYVVLGKNWGHVR
jgi:hypothetical protein